MKINYMINPKSQTEFLTDIYQGLTEISKISQDQNLSDEEFKEKVFTFLRTPEFGMGKRSLTRKMVENFLKQFYKNYDTKLSKDFKKTLPSFVNEVMPVVIRVIENRTEKNNQEQISKEEIFTKLKKLEDRFKSNRNKLIENYCISKSRYKIGDKITGRNGTILIDSILPNYGLFERGYILGVPDILDYPCYYEGYLLKKDGTPMKNRREWISQVNANEINNSTWEDDLKNAFKVGFNLGYGSTEEVTNDKQ